MLNANLIYIVAVMPSRFKAAQMHTYAMRLLGCRPRLIAVHHADLETPPATTAASIEGGLLHGSWADASWWTTSTWTEGERMAPEKLVRPALLAFDLCCLRPRCLQCCCLLRRINHTDQPYKPDPKHITLLVCWVHVLADVHAQMKAGVQLCRLAAPLPSRAQLAAS
jgi:hypothetical protein